MGKLTDDILRWTLDINGKPAMKELAELERSTRKLENTNKGLRVELQKMEAAGKKNTKEYKELQTQIKKNNTTIIANKSKMAALRKELGVNSLTARQLRSEYKRLKNQMDNLTPGTKEWKKLNREMGAVKTRMSQVRGAGGRMNKMFGSLKSLLPMLGIGTLVFSIKKLIKGLAGLDDALANVMKTTGLTRKEARELYADFGHLNTRTPRKELILLAEQAGRLGKKSKKDILDFVEVANMIKVALGDDLAGNAEVAIREVGKLTNIYKIGEKYGTDFKQAMLMIGSSINEVSANSQAQAPFLIETLKRLGGIADQADISAQNVIGYASALDQLGQRQETSATAMSKVIINMFKDVDTYAEIAKMSSEDFLHLLETDANEAFLKFLEGLNGNNDGLTVMAQKLDGLGLDGSRAVQVLAALSSHTQLVREQQDLANKSLEEATSLTDEYNVKNNNMAGNFAKIGQAIRAAFIDSKFIGALEGIVSKVSKWFEIKLSDKLEKERTEVNLLVIEMTNANTTAERRNTIYQTLKDISPDIVKGIDAENISIEKLRITLEKYNQEMIKKIALQESEEGLGEHRELLGKKIAERYKQEQDVIKKINELKGYTKKWDESRLEEIEKISLSSIDLLEKEKQISDIVREISNEQKLGAGITNRSALEASRLKNIREEELELQKEFNKALSEYQNMYESIIGPPGGGAGSPGGGPEEGPEGGAGSTKTFDDWKKDQDKLFIDKNNYIMSKIEEQAEILGKAHQASLEEFGDPLGIPSEETVDDEMSYLMERYQETIDGRLAINQAFYDADEISEAEYNDRKKALYEEDAANHAAISHQKIQKAQAYLQSAQAFTVALTNFNTAAMNRELKAAGDNEKKKEEIHREYAKKQKNIAYLQAIINTALAVTSAATTIPFIPAGLIAAIAAAAIGASEVAVISSTQFASGNYQDVIGALTGKKYRAKVVDKNHPSGLYDEPTYRPGFGMFGETKDPELVFNPADAQKILNTPGLINAINATLGIRQFALGNAREIIRESTTRTETFTDPELKALLVKVAEKLEEPSVAILRADEDYIDNHKNVITKHDEMLDNVNG